MHDIDNENTKETEEKQVGTNTTDNHSVNLLDVIRNAADAVVNPSTIRTTADAVINTLSDGASQIGNALRQILPELNIHGENNGAADRPTQNKETQRELQPGRENGEAQRELQPAREGQQLNGTERELRPLTAERAEAAIQAKLAGYEVSKAISELSPAEQKAFGALNSNKDGTYSQEQLKFIKDNCGAEALGHAFDYNRARERMNSLDQAAQQPNELGSKLNPEALAKQAKLAEQQVSKAISELSPEQQKEFGALKGNKDGTYSNEQLQFIKSNCPKEAYGAAQEYNGARQLLNRVERAGAPAEAAEAGEAAQANVVRREDLAKDAAQAGGKVDEAIAGLPKEQQEEYNNLIGNKGGTLTNEQLSFIKQNCTPEQYGDAQQFNAAQERLNNFDRMTAGLNDGIKNPNDMRYNMSKEELAKHANIAAGEVKQAITELPKEQQKEYAGLKANKDGTFSDDQLKFIKQNCPKEAYGAAQDYNKTLEIMNGMKDVPRPDRIGMKLEAAKAQAQVDKAIGALEPGLQKEYTQLPDAKDGGYSKAQLEFIKANCPEETSAAASRYNELNHNLNMDSLKQRLRDTQDSKELGSKIDPEKLNAHYGKEIAKSEAAVNEALAGMTPEQQEQFASMASPKHMSYTQEQMAFLKENSKEAFMAASTYNAALRAMQDLRMNRLGGNGSDTLPVSPIKKIAPLKFKK